jgi:hypothetical protein
MPGLLPSIGDAESEFDPILLPRLGGNWKGRSLRHRAEPVEAHILE